MPTYADRVKETTTTTGTGSVTLAGAVTGFRAFSSAFSVSNTMYYVIDGVNADGSSSGEWEVGLGTLSAGTTLARTRVIASSNAGSAVSFSAGTKYVYHTVPAEAVIGSGVTISATGALTALSIAEVAGTSAITVTGAMQTTSKPVLDLTQTWNNVATTFTGLKLNVTNTNSASASLLLDLQVASSSIFAVRKDGFVQLSGSAASLSAASCGVGFNGTGIFSTGTNNATAGYWLGASNDVQVVRDAANTLALRNSTNAQLFNVYNTYTDSSNYERLAVKWATNVATIGPENAGTGSARSLTVTSAAGLTLQTTASNVNIMTTGFDDVKIFTANTVRWNFNSSGHFLAGADDTYDIGASAATRPRNIYATRSITSAGATYGIGYATGAGGTVTQITSRSTGVTLNKVTGAITLVSAAGSTTPTTFTVTNSAVAATDVVQLSQKSGADKYVLLVTAVAAGSFDITAYTTGGTTTEQPVINFTILKGVTA